MISGIINLRKEAGMTSHDAVFKLRKILQEKKIGHGGTLDPDVTGVLPIAVGKATRVIEYMTESGKVYEGEITLGYATTTEDASGDVIETTPVPEQLTVETIDLAMTSLTGEITQIPPMYSAVKVNGKRLYEYAREGQIVERPQRQIFIKEFVRTSPLKKDGSVVRFSFRVTCSKGTYVRTLSVDLGKRLGLASHMSFLKRTVSAGLTLEQAYALSDIKELVEKGDFSFLLPVEYGLADLAATTISQEEVDHIRHGRFISLDHDAEILVAYHDDKAIAVLEKRDNWYKPKKVLIL